MPTYLIEGKKVRAEKPLTDAEIDEIGSSIRGGPAAAPSEIPRRRGPSLADIGDRAMGFRPAGQSPQMNLAQGVEGLKTAAALGAGIVAGPVVAAGIRAASAAPAAATLARAVQSGGLAKDLSIPMRIAGGGIAGGAATAVTEPEDILTGAAIGAATLVPFA